MLDLLEAGQRVQEPDVQRGVVSDQRLVSVVSNELHQRRERQWLREAKLPVSVVDLYQLVVASLPEPKEEEEQVLLKTQESLWMLHQKFT